MSTLATIRTQTMAFRKAIRALSAPYRDQADVMPATWRNNLRWHLGHLVVTPRLLTVGLFQEPLGVADNYKRWFAKGTSPADWGADTVPSFDRLLEEVEDLSAALFEELDGRADAPFPAPYTTSVGVELASPLEALSFSLAHDGIHIGMIFALRRALG